MSKSFKIILGLLIAAIALVVYLESTKKDPLNWSQTYSKSDKIPYGTFVLYNTLKDTRAFNTFKEVDQPPFEFLSEDNDFEKSTYLFLNSYISFDDAESNKLLSWVAEGNTMFIGARSIGKTILDTLNLDINTIYEYNNFEHKPLVNLVNPELHRALPYYLDLEVDGSYFSKVDTLHTKVLGEFSFTKKKDTTKIIEPKVNFIKQPFGDGEIYIHLLPDAFTNYFMLREQNYTYAQNVLSYIDNNSVLLWDNHHNNGKTRATSILYVFFSNRYLKWAYYMLIIGTLLWVIFEGRRKQRAVPIVKPLPNQTLAFTKTIAGMYLDKKDHKSISTHQINHFLEYIRSNYRLNTNKINDAFISDLAGKSSNSLEDTKLLINFIVSMRNKSIITSDDLMTLNKRIEDFKTSK